MGQSLRDILVRQVSAPTDDAFLSDYWAKKYFDWSSEDPGNEAVKERIYQKRLGELSWQDLLKSNFQRGVVQSGVPLNKGVEDELIKALDATGWSEDQKRQAVLGAVDKHYNTYGQAFTEWSGPEGIKGLLGLPTGDTMAELARYSGAHSKDAAEADANSQTNAIQLGSVLLAPLAAAAFAPAAGAAGAGAGAGGAAAFEAGALAGAPGYGAALEGSLAGVAGAGAGAADASWGVNQAGGGMDWYDEFLQSIGVDPASTQFTGGTLSNADIMAQINGAGYGASGGIWETIKNIPSSILKTLGGGDDAKGLTKLLGSLGSAGLGAYASSQQSGDYKDLADKYLSLGGPSRARYEASYSPGFSIADADPGYKDALAITTKETLHKLSPGGNPAGSPNAWEQTLMDVNTKLALPQLNEYRRLNAGSGGLAALNAAAASFDNSAVRSQGNIYDAIGSGAADVFNPKRTLADILREARV